MNYERISIVVVLALLLFVGMALIGDGGVRAFRSILISLQDQTG